MIIDVKGVVVAPLHLSVLICSKYFFDFHLVSQNVFATPLRLPVIHNLLPLRIGSEK